ncbi:diguanylate cyclase, partial [Chromatium okenii]|uniref:diguanylate cyclase domain-containing protein n=1 Tax=Chromatium okenii TaxID=61644 RepID=UPI0034E94B0C
MRILVVDDVSDNVRMLSRILVDEGHQVSAATAGETALRLVESCNPDLILLDVMMPGMDGYQVCSALKANPQFQNIPVIFITALTDTEDEVRGLELGAVDYIIKPFKDVIVRMRVRTHLELKRQRDILNQLSHFDGLTGIPNRRAFDERLAQEWKRACRNRDHLAVLMIDIDFFKQYNDAYGHLAGDDCLRRIAGALAKQMQRGSDFVARYGGEEFVCLISGIDQASLAIVTEQLRVNIAVQQIPHSTSSVARYVTISVGAAFCQPTLDSSAFDLMAHADAQLFTAKHLGRNRVSLA